MPPRLLVSCGLVVVAACSSSPNPADATVTDVGTDGGTDGGLDTSVPDTATPDTAAPDTSRPDTSQPDTSMPDVRDTSVPDTRDAGVTPSCTFTAPALTNVAIAPMVTFASPMQVVQAPGETTALWVVQRNGLIRLVRNPGTDATATDFLDITGTIGSAPGGSDERGLHSMAFHPNWPTDRRFYVAYTPTREGRNVVAEYTTTAADRYVAETTEVRRLVNIRDTEGNHNGGQIMFGPDGFLYYGSGDGGGGGDVHGTIGNGLNLTTLLGKILRLDVDNVAGEFVAAGNPLPSPALPQIWAYGVRNPWRFSFDKMNGDFWMGDVGQGEWEEVNLQRRASTGGENYGWRAYEGFEVYDRALVTMVPNHASPVAVVSHSSSLLGGTCSITGGFVYRGTAITALAGLYLFGDYCGPRLAAIRDCGDGTFAGPTRVGTWNEPGGLSSFGQDNAGELYATFLNGEVVRIVSP